MDINLRPRALRKIRVARNMVRVKMGFDDVRDPHPACLSGINILLNAAVWVDYRGDSLRLAAYQVRSAAQTIHEKLLNIHWYSLLRQELWQIIHK